MDLRENRWREAGERQKTSEGKRGKKKKKESQDEDDYKEKTWKMREAMRSDKRYDIRYDNSIII